ncbi:hypothetical protein A6B43_01485 [Vespertiliibacter pulmonis]|uniref:Lipoprotein n=1 Tax=Vespertiliibacter pulmonis TaxID=1443036 RepID=A0A3N4VTC5_9PAST|nr:hypothetical protein [Vespertiliibacter pulmonis]QLB20305.1 hypothetical protein A6B43_01485 [Vespertiliibacter pulmonis]RPE86288.1 hypothetical protein EDC46_0683 [Vespertiliibacter pulmonis]
MKRLLLVASLFLSACSSQESTYPLKPKPQDQETLSNLIDKDPVSAMEKATNIRAKSEFLNKEYQEIAKQARNKINALNSSHNLPKVTVKEYHNQ